MIGFHKRPFSSSFPKQIGLSRDPAPFLCSARGARKIKHTSLRVWLLRIRSVLCVTSCYSAKKVREARKVRTLSRCKTAKVAGNACQPTRSAGDFKRGERLELPSLCGGRGASRDGFMRKHKTAQSDDWASLRINLGHCPERSRRMKRLNPYLSARSCPEQSGRTAKILSATARQEK